MTDDIAPGQYNAVCDRCGFEFLSGKIKREWTGLRVCHGPGTNDCFEARHPQDFVKGRKDKQTVPWSRPEPPDVFRTVATWDDDAKAWVEE